MGWQVYKINPDPLLLGFIGLCEAVPAIGFALFAGHWVDFGRPLSFYRWSLFALILNAMMMWVVVFPEFPFPTWLRIAGLFTGVFVSGIARTFIAPCIFSILPRSVPAEKLPSAIAWNMSAFQFAAIAGPIIGGSVYGLAGLSATLTLPIVLPGLALFSTLSFSDEIVTLKGGGVRESMSKSLKLGIAFVRSKRVLLATLLLDMFSVLFGGAVAVLPLFADQILKVGSTGLGLLRAAPAVGAATIALLLARSKWSLTSGRALLWVVAGFGVCMIGFGLSTSLYLSLGLLFLSGVIDGTSSIIRGTILQKLTPSSMRGRVSAINSVFITSSNEIGSFESGVAAKLMGLVPSVVFGGVATLVVVLGVHRFFPELSRSDHQEP